MKEKKEQKCGYSVKNKTNKKKINNEKRILFLLFVIIRF